MQTAVQAILSEMTMEEKMAQLNSVEAKNIVDADNRFSAEKAEKYMRQGIGHVAGIGYALNVMPHEAATIANALQQWLSVHTRLRIPAIVHEECLAGLAAHGSAAFPHPLGLASMWDPGLVKRMAELTRIHVRSIGSHQALSPVLDLAGDPRWGRCEETYGEDAYLVAANAAAYVLGLQGDDLKLGVAATAKHFAGHGYSEGGRNCAPVRIGPRELRDTVLFPFEAVVRQCGIKSIMNAYHDIDGIPCAASGELLTKILRDEWGFDGVVVSDYFAVERLMSHHFTAGSKGEAGKQALEAGLDMELPSRDCYGDELMELVLSGSVPESIIDRSVERVLTLKAQLGLFDGTWVDPSGATRVFANFSNTALALELARKSIILLKNEGGTLPLDRNVLRSVAVIGPNAASKRNLLGDYSYIAMNPQFADQSTDSETAAEKAMGRKLVTVWDALREKLGPEIQINYARGCDIWNPGREGFVEAVNAARESDVAIVVVGDRGGMFNQGVTSGENVDRANISLYGVQAELVEAVINTGKPVVLVLVNGRPLAVKELTDKAAAVVEAWFPGEQGGTAIADVLFGDYNPGGKLPVTLLRSLGQYPMGYNLKPVSVKDYIDKEAKPNFPFGHGLSYTTFHYSALNITPRVVGSEATVTISLTIRNTGDVFGEEVVQLYVRDEIASVARPGKELKGFDRIGLAAGDTKNVEFMLYLDQLAFHDVSGKLTIEPGRFKVMLGSSSSNIRLEGAFTITGDNCIIIKNKTKYFSNVTVL